ncbi:T9SS type A sorting domain-containing protein [candidate division KSB1 bacterium]|nr:T9SS type A sorting domain-containing protein [candidate division KSB1 bacterium]
MSKYMFHIIGGCLVISLILCLPAFALSGGQLGGTIYYNGLQSGPVKIVAVSFPPNLEKPFTHTTIDAIGEYHIEALDDGLYFVGAFMDVDGNQLPHYSEPIGIFRSPVYIIDGSSVSSVSFALKDLPRGTASFSGIIQYPGTQSGRLHVFALGWSLTPITISSFNLGAENTYKLEGLAKGKYLVAAYLDTDGNCMPGFNEPLGIARDVVYLGHGEKMLLPDLYLLDNVNYSGSISGTISYNGAESGEPIIVCGGFSNTPLKMIDADLTSGSYMIENLAPGSYRLFAFLDCDQNRSFSLGEPFSETYVRSIELDADTDVTGIAIELEDYGASTIAGNVSYSGANQGIIATMAFGLSPTPINLALNTAPGEYELNGLAAGIYAVGSFMDANLNLIPEASDPMGLFTDSLITLHSDQKISNVNIVLDNTPEAAISGNIISTDNSAATVYIASFGYATTPLKLIKVKGETFYQISGLAAGKYIVAAFKDLDGNAMFTLDEPYAFTDGVVNVPRDEEVVDINLNLATDGQFVSGIDDDAIFFENIQYALAPNFPNPFNPATIISYQVPELSMVNITIYNLLGQEIIRLVNERKAMGTHRVVWDGVDRNGRIVPAGVYIYSMQAGTYSEVKKMTLIR